MSKANDSSRKTSKKKRVAPKPPEKKGRGLKRTGTLPPSGLAEQKTRLAPPRKKPSAAARVGLSAAIALGAVGASRTADARAMDKQEAPLAGLPTYEMKPQAPMASMESISYFLHSMKEETDRYRKSPKSDSFEVPLGEGAKLRLRLDSIGKTLSFAVSAPGKRSRFFRISFEDLGMANPEVRIKDQGMALAVSLLDSMNKKHARFTFLKSDISLDKMMTMVFDENADVAAALYIFHSLNNLPEVSISPDTAESRAFLEAFRDAELSLLRLTSGIEFASSSPEDKRKAFERTVDSFISLYSEVGGDAMDSLASIMKGMDRKEKGKVIEFALPRLVAIMLRPYAAWSDPTSLNDLDRIISSPDFSDSMVREFAWHNDLQGQYNFLLRDIREKLSRRVS